MRLELEEGGRREERRREGEGKQGMKDGRRERGR